jgi:hypothetical protein
LSSLASEQATLKASRAFSEKSAANKMVRKGFMGVLLFILQTPEGNVSATSGCFVHSAVRSSGSTPRVRSIWITASNWTGRLE